MKKIAANNPSKAKLLIFNLAIELAKSKKLTPEMHKMLFKNISKPPNQDNGSNDLILLPYHNEKKAA